MMVLSSATTGRPPCSALRISGATFRYIPYHHDRVPFNWRDEIPAETQRRRDKRRERTRETKQSRDGRSRFLPPRRGSSLHFSDAFSALISAPLRLCVEQHLRAPAYRAARSSRKMRRASLYSLDSMGPSLPDCSASARSSAKTPFTAWNAVTHASTTSSL